MENICGYYQDGTCTHWGVNCHVVPLKNCASIEDLQTVFAK